MTLELVFGVASWRTDYLDVDLEATHGACLAECGKLWEAQEGACVFIA